MLAIKMLMRFPICVAGATVAKQKKSCERSQGMHDFMFVVLNVAALRWKGPVA